MITQNYKMDKPFLPYGCFLSVALRQQQEKKDKGPYHPEFTFQQGGSLVSNPLLSRLGGVRAHEQRLDGGREGE